MSATRNSCNTSSKGIVTGTIRRVGLTGKMAHDDLVCPPPIFSCNHPARRLALCAFHPQAIATSRTCSPSAGWMSSYETAQQSRRSDCRLATSRACARTTEPRIRISRPDGASTKFSASNRPDQRSASFQFTPSFTTHSTSNAISHLAARSASSGTKHSGHGELLPLHESQKRKSEVPRRNECSCDNALHTDLAHQFHRTSVRGF